MGVLASALRRNVGDGALKNLEERLLYAFSGDIAGNGGVLVFASDFVNLVNIDDALLRAGDVAICGLQQLEDDVLNILADVAGFSERGCIDNRKGNVEHLGQGVREKGFAGACGADEQDVGLGELNFIVAHAIHLDALVVVVDGHGEFLLGLLLADDIIVEVALDLTGLGEVQRAGSSTGFSATVVVKDGVANGNTLVADESAWVVAW